MKFDLETEKSPYSDYDEEIVRIIIDGIKDENSDVQTDWLYLESAEVFQKIKCFKYNEVSKHFFTIQYKFDVDWYEYPIMITITTPNSFDPPYISITPKIKVLSWNKPYTVNELASTYEQVCKTIESIEFSDHRSFEEEDQGNFFGIEVSIDNNSHLIGDAVDFLIEKLKEVHLLSLEVLSRNFIEGSITTLFNFPPEIRSVCNQYLMYFAQFLEDLGIRTETSLKEHANQVLFTVTPKEKNQALDVIQKALSSYLEAANDGVIESINGSDLAIMQLKANVYHLKSQLELSKALIQAKDETIEAMKLSNYQLQTYIPHNGSEKKTNNQEEKVLGGIVSIKKYEGKGFSVDLAEIYRKLKRRFK